MTQNNHKYLKNSIFRLLSHIANTSVSPCQNTPPDKVALTFSSNFNLFERGFNSFFYNTNLILLSVVG